MSEPKQFFPPGSHNCDYDSPRDPEIHSLAEALLSDGEPANVPAKAEPWWEQLTPEQFDQFNSLD